MTQSLNSCNPIDIYCYTITRFQNFCIHYRVLFRVPWFAIFINYFFIADKLKNTWLPFKKFTQKYLYWSPKCLRLSTILNHISIIKMGHISRSHIILILKKCSCNKSKIKIIKDWCQNWIIVGAITLSLIVWNSFHQSIMRTICTFESFLQLQYKSLVETCKEN